MDLKPGVATYNAKIEMGPNSLPMTVTRTITEQGGAWVVNESATMAMGTISDETTLEKGSLTLRKRIVKQGPAVIEVDFAGGKASGKMSMNGQDRPITADLGGALFADGAGANDAVAALPLKAGYTASYRNFDVMKQQVSLRELTVVGTEKVTVPAGTFDTHKVEIMSPDGGKQTLWIDVPTHRVVRTMAVLPAMNGAIATSELAK